MPLSPDKESTLNTDQKIKKRIHDARNTLKITAKVAAQCIRDAGYDMSDGSYRNLETDSSSSATVNRLMITAIAKAFEMNVYDLVGHHEMSELPTKPLHNGSRAPRKERTPEKEELVLLRQVLRGIGRVHIQDPVDTDCCAGCEMLWPCTTRELIDIHAARMKD